MLRGLVLHLNSGSILLWRLILLQIHLIGEHHACWGVHCWVLVAVLASERVDVCEGYVRIVVVDVLCLLNRYHHEWLHPGRPCCHLLDYFVLLLLEVLLTGGALGYVKGHLLGFLADCDCLYFFVGSLHVFQQTMQPPIHHIMTNGGVHYFYHVHLLLRRLLKLIRLVFWALWARRFSGELITSIVVLDFSLQPAVLILAESLWADCRLAKLLRLGLIQ